MGLLDRIRSWGAQSATPVVASPMVPVHAYTVIDLAGDAGLLDFMRNGNAAGATVNRRTILKNASVARCVFLISNAIGMLPLPLMKAGEGGERAKARDHHLYDLLTIKPNGWQSAFEFKRLLQHRALTDGNGYARIIRGMRDKPVALIPIAADHMKVSQRDDWSIKYEMRNKSGGYREIDAADMLHIRGPSEDGFRGLALTDYAAEVLGLSLRANEAAAKIFSQGFMAAGGFKTSSKLSAQAYQNLRESVDERFSGAENAGKFVIMEDGLDYVPFASTAKDAQNVETREHQIEEVARIFGVPRPFLMMDDTSWGTGIEQLGMFFVQYGLAPWFKAWEEAISLSLLTEQERRAGYYPKFNERALLRGSMKDQGEFFAKMMGAGGTPQIMEQNEARQLLDLPDHPDGSGLSSGAMAAKPAGVTSNE